MPKKKAVTMVKPPVVGVGLLWELLYPGTSSRLSLGAITLTMKNPPPRDIKKRITVKKRRFNGLSPRHILLPENWGPLPPTTEI
jgi:hypothetical protein